MDEAAPAPRRLAELRVAELRLELERRGLEPKGIKAVLLDRLQQAITEEGENPDEYMFDCTPINDKKTPAKKSNLPDGTSEEYEETMDDVIMENLVVKDEITDEDSNIGSNDNLSSSDIKPVILSSNQIAIVKMESASANEAIAENGSKCPVSKKREASNEAEMPQPKKVCKDNKDANGLDGEDSINLDIGEDEFLNEDGEAGSNLRKDVKKEVQGVVDSTKQKPDEGILPAAEKEDVPAEPSLQDVKEEKSSEVTAAEANSNVSISEQDKSDKDAKKSSPQSQSASSRNLWVSGLSSSTRAKDLKQLCSTHGKVIGAKIVINARTPGSRCYGYITMSSAEDAQNCIKHLHRTELHGRMISMEKAKSESITGTSYGTGTSISINQTSLSPRRLPNTEKMVSSAEKKKEPPAKAASVKEKDVKTADVKRDADGNVIVKEENENTGSVSTTENDVKPGNTKSKQRERIRPDRPNRNPSSRDFLSFSKIKKEREAQRARELVRRARSEERRRHAAERSLRELESRHRDEKHRQRVEKERLALEREKIRIEREKIDREKHELQRLERDRQKLERDRLDLERLELKRAQMRLEEERERAVAKRNYIYNSSGSGSTGLLPRSKEPLPPPPPVYERSSGRGGDNSGSSNSTRYNMPPSSHLNAPPPTYEMSAGSSSGSKHVDRGRPTSRDRRERERPRDFKRDYPPPAPRSSHTGVSGSGIKYSSNGPSYESRQPLPPGTRPREQRYAMETSDVRSSADVRGGRSGGGGNHERAGGGSSNYRPSDSSRRSPKTTSRDHRYSDSSMPMKGDSWSNSGMGSESGGRYGGTASSSGQYNDSRYSGSYQPTPPGSVSYPNLVCYPAPREFRPKY